MRNLVALLLLLPLFVTADNTLSKQEYQVLTDARDLMDAGNLTQARQRLMEAKDTMRSEYARALIQHNLGQIELQRDNYLKAIEYLTQAYLTEQFQDDQQANLMHTLAQLHCMEEQWRLGVDYLEKWMAMRAPEQIKDTDQLLLAQAYSQLENWAKVVKFSGVAISRRAVPPENWYQLKIAAHIRLKQWRAAISEQKKMLAHYSDKPENWRQLVSMQLHINDSKQALSTQRMAFERSVLEKDKDYRLLAQLLLQAEIPYYAGQVLEQGIEKGILNADKKTLRLLSGSWIQSREYEKAIDSLEQLNDIAPTKQSLEQLAQMQIELEQWQSAKRTINKALKLSGKKERLHLLLGIAEIKLQSYDSARRALSVAANDKQLRSSAEGWMRYLEQIGTDEALLSKEG